MTPFVRPEHRAAWQALGKLATQSSLRLDRLLEQPGRRDAYTFQAPGLSLDIQAQRVDDQVMQALFDLAQESDVTGRIQALFRGEAVNCTEHRPALHMALRGPALDLAPWPEAVSHLVQAQQQRFLDFARAVRAGQWKGHDGSALVHVVNIGIGGSDLGPRMATHALALHAPQSKVRVHYVSNPDPEAIERLLNDLPPQQTGFIVQSKSFTTQETMALNRAARSWLQAGGCPEGRLCDHFVAVTAQPDLARTQGIAPDRIFEFWDWVGGRYSVWSAIGLPLAIAAGPDVFRAFLAGAHEMDRHFLQSPIERNVPLIMALIGVWNVNFLGATSVNVAPYAYALQLFVPFLQQLEMESNGKRTHLDVSQTQIRTCPVVWGGLGMDAQHAYFQMLHQGTETVPVDFIGVCDTSSKWPRAQNLHHMTLKNMQAQSRAFALGRDGEATLSVMRSEGCSQAQASALSPHRTYPGNHPSSILWLERMDASTLGALIALYEHKVYCQSVLWGINPFDQWGVELGKTMAQQMNNAN